MNDSMKKTFDTHLLPPVGLIM